MMMFIVLGENDFTEVFGAKRSTSIVILHRLFNNTLVHAYVCPVPRQEYARKAKLMTSIHAMKRTTSMTGECPRDNQQAGSEKKKAEEGSEAISSPKQGKAEKRKVLEKKRSLRRL